MSEKNPALPHNPWRLFELVHLNHGDVDRDVDFSLVKAGAVQLLADVVSERRDKNVFSQNNKFQ